MDLNFLVPLLMMFTLLAGLIFALVSAKRTRDQQHDPKHHASSMATDGSSHRPEKPDALE